MKNHAHKNFEKKYVQKHNYEEAKEIINRQKNNNRELDYYTIQNFNSTYQHDCQIPL